MTTPFRSDQVQEPPDPERVLLREFSHGGAGHDDGVVVGQTKVLALCLDSVR